MNVSELTRIVRACSVFKREILTTREHTDIHSYKISIINDTYI